MRSTNALILSMLTLTTVPFAAAGGLAPRTPIPKPPVVRPSGGAPFAIHLKFVDHARVRATPDGLESRADPRVDLSAVLGVARALDLRFEPLIRLPESRLADLQARAEARTGVAAADLAGMIAVRVEETEEDHLLMLAERLRALELVEYVVLDSSTPTPPGDVAPATPNLGSNQDYFGPNPGLDVDYARARGFRGAGVRLSDCEYGWVYSHEDLVDKNLHPEPGQTIHPNVVANGWDEHGTAVLGETSSVVNAYGCAGIAPDAEIYTFTEWSVEEGHRRVTAITNAIASSSPGDVVLLEMQASGAGGGYGPAELSASVWLVTKTGTDAGVVVVGAAGNGNQDLDGSAYASYLAKGDSGAIVVGAGTDSVTHSKLSFSTFGSRVNVQGWGGGVFSLGYGGFAEYGGDKNQRYTSSFSGTSSASPFVAASCAILQEVAIAATGTPLMPKVLRQLLIDTGRPQGSGGHIGPFPDLRAAIDALFPLWTDLGGALPGTNGLPSLVGEGALKPATNWRLSLTHARPSAAALLFVGASIASLPFLGGTLLPSPDLVVPIVVPASGTLPLAGTAPPIAVSGIDLVFQFWVDDPAGVAGAAASNAVKVTTP